MAKLTDKTALTTPSSSDLIHVVDVSDTTGSPQGTSKKVTLSDLLYVENSNGSLRQRLYANGVGVSALTSWGFPDETAYWAVGISDTSNDFHIAYDTSELSSVLGNSLFCIRTDGKVGIGNTDPQAALQIGNTSGNKTFANAGILLTGFDNEVSVDAFKVVDENDGVVFSIKTEGDATVGGAKVGIGTGSPDATLHVTRSTPYYAFKVDQQAEYIGAFFESDAVNNDKHCVYTRLNGIVSSNYIACYYGKVDSTSATGGHVYYGSHKGTGGSVLRTWISKSGSSAKSISLLHDNSANSSYAVELTHYGTGTGIYSNHPGEGVGIYQTTAAVNKAGIAVYSNAARTGVAGNSLFSAWQDNASSTGYVGHFRQDGNGVTVYVDYNGTDNSVIFNVSSNASHTGSYIAGSGNGCTFHIGDPDTNYRGSYSFERNKASADTAGAVVNVQNSHTGDDQATFRVYNNAPAVGTKLEQHGDAAHIRFIGDPSNSSPTDGDFWFDGTDLKLRVGSTTYTLDKTSV